MFRIAGHARMAVHVVEQDKPLGQAGFLAAELMGAGPADPGKQPKGLGLFKEPMHGMGCLGQLGHKFGRLPFQHHLGFVALFPVVDGV